MAKSSYHDLVNFMHYKADLHFLVDLSYLEERKLGLEILRSFNENLNGEIQGLANYYFQLEYVIHYFVMDLYFANRLMVLLLIEGFAFVFLNLKSSDEIFELWYSVTVSGQ